MLFCWASLNLTLPIPYIRFPDGEACCSDLSPEAACFATQHSKPLVAHEALFALFQSWSEAHMKFGPMQRSALQKVSDLLILFPSASASPSSSVLCCLKHFVSELVFPLCNKDIKISKLTTLYKGHPIRSIIAYTELLSVTHSFTDICRSKLQAHMLGLYNSRHRS